MSYCRFSSDNFACDVYVYESDPGWTTHVAGNRVVGDVPKVNFSPEIDRKTLRAQMMAQRDFMETARREQIDLPFAGETFVDDTPGQCADRLESLRTLGYNVPQYAIDALREELAELAITFRDLYPGVNIFVDAKAGIVELFGLGFSYEIEVSDELLPYKLSTSGVALGQFRDQTDLLAMIAK